MTSGQSPMAASRLNRQTWFAMIGMPVGAMAAVALTSAAMLPTLCPFRLGTGHACPGCGITRGVAAAVKGDLGLSLRFHPMALLIALQLLVLWGAFIFTTSDRWSRMMPKVAAIALVNVAGMLIVWGVRWKLGLLDFVL